MAGTLIVSNLTTDTDNTFIVRSNTGTTLFSANTSGIDVANSIGATAITNDKILSVANTKISGNIISSQITSVANTQLTGLIQAAQIGSANATLVTSGTLPIARLPAGSVLQVVQGNYYTGFSTSSTTFVDTGLSASITPTSSSSKILVIVNQPGFNIYASGGTAVISNLVRGSTEILRMGQTQTSTTTFSFYGINALYLDSPATTSSTTYKTQVRHQNTAGAGNTVYLNWASDVNGSSIMILMEIAA